jgi:hypothetical protein
MPPGWQFGESNPGDYECSLDSSTKYQGQPVVYLKAKSDAALTGFGTMQQYFSAGQYTGKRVRFSAYIKAQGIDPRPSWESWAGLWMRVVDATQRDFKGGPRVLVLDNMHQTGPDRAIKGTRDWQNYSVVVDVAPNATGIGLGILLSGVGEVWISGMKVETVGLDLPVPVAPLAAVDTMHDGSTNRGFEK